MRPHWVFPVSAILMRLGNVCLADTVTLDVAQLPPLRVNGVAAKAHTQGLEVHEGKYYVTARREDLRPRRALLLRTETTGTNWNVWDLTPVDSTGGQSALDHPGGMQSDGKRLWIPVAESKPKSRSIIRVVPLADLVPGRPLKSAFEFDVEDHIGALAVAADRRLVFGANWDTEAIYIWDLNGHLKQKLSGAALADRGLGFVADSASGSGVAVQDWKAVGNRLVASGLCRVPGATATSTRSRWLSFTNFLEPDFQHCIVPLPLQQGTELAREAMAVSDGLVYFLPEDLGATNRLFRIPITKLLANSAAP
jgi:hypothetical protein